jgi:predicted ribosome quality control (RQC) complex YloA/Tae2 family protein
VQSVVQPDRLTVAFELYARDHGRMTLTLSADPRREGVRLESAKSRRGGGQPSPLTLAAGAHLVGTRLAAVEQPSWERMLRLTFQAPPAGAGSDAGPASWTLVAELMGRMANLILIDAGGVIRACAKQVNAEMSRARTVIPGARYVPPPPQPRMAAERVTEADVAGWLHDAAGAGEPAWRAVVKNLAGVSPLSSREAVCRAMGTASGQVPNGLDAGAGEVPAPALAAAIGSLFDPGAVCPWLAFDAGGRPTAYAAYELTHLGGEESSSVLEALARYEDDGAERDAYGGARESVEGQIAAALLRLERRRASIERAADESGAADDLRLRADLILAYQHSVVRGQTEMLAPAGEDGPAAIKLDPAKTAVANAEAYYRRARRAERAAEGRARRLEEVGAEIGYLDQLGYDLEVARDRPQIDAVAAALAESGALGSAGRGAARRSGGSRSPAPPGEPMRLVTEDGFTVWVGRNARQNERVTFQKAARGDVWLHAQNVPGAHVVVKAAGRDIPESSILAAAAAAAWYSRVRGESSASVWVVDSRRIRRPAGGRPGMVTFDEGRSVVVRPAALSSGPGPMDEGEDR